MNHSIWSLSIGTQLEPAIVELRMDVAPGGNAVLVAGEELVDMGLPAVEGLEYRLAKLVQRL